MRFTDDYPELGTGPVPIDSLISRAFFERERDNLFKQVWLKVGRVEEIANPGDYKVKQLAFAHTAAIIVRGKDSAIRAFHNIWPASRQQADPGGRKRNLRPRPRRHAELPFPRLDIPDRRRHPRCSA